MDVSQERIMRRIERLAGFTATPGKGSTRTTYTPEFRQALDFLSRECRALGLDPVVDGIGNLRCRLPGRDNAAPGVMTGSHIDTVIHGGDYDGVVGSVAALEVLAVLQENRFVPAVPVEIVIFAEEEGVTFDLSLAGSKALVGRMTLADMKVRTSNTDGRSLYQTARDFGLDPDGLPQSVLRPAEVSAMIELHIEQSIALEHDLLQIGVIEKIAGSFNYVVEVFGTANHAGATPMRLRRDALVGAALMIQEIEALARAEGRDEAVATVGRLAVAPNAANVIPNHVSFTFDLRDTDPDRMAERLAETLAALDRIAQVRRLDVTARRTGTNAPIALSGILADLVEDCAKARGYSYKRMHSGALHDTAVLAELAPSCMIFVPSRDGRSHAPEEFTDPEEIRRGVQLVVDTIVKLTG